jgi:hypothetical protein
MTRRERNYHREKKVWKSFVKMQSEPDGPHYFYEPSLKPLFDCNAIDTTDDEHPQWAEPGIPRTILCSKSVYERFKEQSTEAKTLNLNLGSHCVEVRESSMFPYEKMWTACDIENKTEHQIPSGEWVHGIMVAPPPPREQSIGLMMTEKPAYHPYLDKVREEMYGYQYRFMTF